MRHLRISKSEFIKEEQSGYKVNKADSEKETDLKNEVDLENETDLKGETDPVDKTRP
jgi:hypothetical protein